MCGNLKRTPATFDGAWQEEPQTQFCPHCHEPLPDYLQEAANLAWVIPPVGRDDWAAFYLDLKSLDENAKLRGISTKRLRREKSDLQRLAWVYHPKDRRLYLVRIKDLTGKQSLRPKANCPLHLPYIPTEIVDITGDRIASLREEQSLWLTGHGPRVQPGQIETVPYFEDEGASEYDALDNDNFPMQIAI